MVERSILSRPTRLKNGLGRVSQKVTTSSAEAQAFYDQGLAQLHSFVWIEAARSFHEALRRDPKLAMAWLGISRAEGEMGLPLEAREAIAKAQELAASAGEKERRLIALRVQMMDAESADAPAQRDGHEAYKRAVEEAIAADPADPELWILRGQAEEANVWGRGQEGGVGAVAFFEAALRRAPGHFGAHHYLAHSFENIGRYEQAAVHAKAYAAAAPAVAHAQHIYGHILPRLGRWEEALRQFENADALGRAYEAAERLRPGDDWHQFHNLDLLGYTYLRLGRLDLAEKTFRRAFDTPIRNPLFGWRHVGLPEFYLAAGRPRDAAETARALASGDSAAARAAARALEGEANLAMGQLDEARRASADAAAALAEATRDDDYSAQFFARFVGTFLLQLDGELKLRGEKPEEGEEILLQLADQIASYRTFDSWGEGFVRLGRIAREAERAGRAALARQVRERLRKLEAGGLPARDRDPRGAPADIHLVPPEN